MNTKIQGILAGSTLALVMVLCGIVSFAPSASAGVPGYYFFRLTHVSPQNNANINTGVADFVMDVSIPDKPASDMEAPDPTFFLNQSIPLGLSACRYDAIPAGSYASPAACTEIASTNVIFSKINSTVRVTVKNVHLPYPGENYIRCNMSTGEAKCYNQESSLWFPGHLAPEIRLINGSAPPPPLSTYQSANRTSKSSSNSAFNGEPINMIGGNMLATREEITVPGRDLPVRFSLNYNSALGDQNSPVGFGWTHSYRISAITESSGAAVITYEDGRMERFTPNSSMPGSFSPPPGNHDSLSRNSDGAYRLKRKNQIVYDFNASGLLASVISPNGNKQGLTYNDLGQLTRLTDVVGRAFNFEYDSSSHIAKITDPASRNISYAYDSSGNLISATNPAGGVTKYEYDSSHRLTGITDALGNKAVTNVYDSSGRVISQKDAQSGELKLAYETGKTTYTDARGGETTYFYDDELRLTKEQDALGNATTHTYDSQNNRTSTTDALGHKTAFAYDIGGNVTQITDPAGSKTKITYDAASRPTTVTDALNHKTSFTYDAKGNPIERKDAKSKKTKLRYDTFGQLISSKDPLKATTKYTYDDKGNLTTSTDPIKRKSSIAYDAIGRATTITDPEGHKTTFVYDNLDRLTATTDALGNSTKVEYDAAGNKLKLTDPNGHITSHSYDAANRLTKVIDALNNATNYTYDPNGNMVNMIDAKNAQTSYEYDSVNQMISSLNPLSKKTTYTYDATGKITSTTNPKGQKTEYSYDGLGRLISSKYADNSLVQYSYDALGNRKEMLDPTGKTVYAYDVLNNLTSVTSPDSKKVLYTYDAASRRSSLKYPDGQSMKYEYNLAGELIKAKGRNGKTTTYAYDPSGDMTKVAYPNSVIRTYGYDVADRLTTVKNSNKRSILDSYQYALDASGNRTSVTDKDGKETKYSYDNLDRLVGVNGPKIEQSFVYDPVGNRLSMTDAKQMTGYTYNAADEILTAGATTFSYDEAGNRIQKKDGSIATNYSYDSAGRLSSISRPNNLEESFTYDGDGNRVKVKHGSGTVSSYVLDTAAGLPKVLSETTQNNKTTNYEYGLGLMAEDGPGKKDTLYYQFDGLGSVTGQTNNKGKSTDQYTYDAWGNVESGNINGESFGFAGEQQNEDTELVYLRARYYDSTSGAFLSRDRFAGYTHSPSTLHKYIYAANNPVNFTDPTGLFALGIGLSGEVSLGFLRASGSVNFVAASNGDFGLVYTVGDSAAFVPTEAEGAFSLTIPWSTASSLCQLTGTDASVGGSVYTPLGGVGYDQSLKGNSGEVHLGVGGGAEAHIGVNRSQAWKWGNSQDILEALGYYNYNQ